MSLLTAVSTWLKDNANVQPKLDELVPQPRFKRKKRKIKVTIAFNSAWKKEGNEKDLVDYSSERDRDSSESSDSHSDAPTYEGVRVTNCCVHDI